MLRLFVFACFALAVCSSPVPEERNEKDIQDPENEATLIYKRSKRSEGPDGENLSGMDVNEGPNKRQFKRQYPPGRPSAYPGYGQPGQSGAPPNPYGQQSQSPYGQPPVGQSPYGQPPGGQSPYGQPPGGQSPYGQPPGGQSPYGPPQGAPGQYGQAPPAPPAATAPASPYDTMARPSPPSSNPYARPSNPASVPPNAPPYGQGYPGQPFGQQPGGSPYGQPGQQYGGAGGYGR